MGRTEGTVGICEAAERGAFSGEGLRKPLDFHLTHGARGRNHRDTGKECT